MYELSTKACSNVSGGFFEAAFLSDSEQFSAALKAAGDDVIDSGALAMQYSWDHNNEDGDGQAGDYKWWLTEDVNVILVDVNDENGPDTSVEKISNTLYKITTEVGNEEYVTVGNKGPVDELFDKIFGDAKAALDSFLDRMGDTASALGKRDDASTFNRDNVTDFYQNNEFVGYIDNNNHNIIWLDRNGNGQPETVLKYFPGGQIWQDTNFDGTWDRRVR